MKRQNKADQPRPLPHLAKLAERLESTASWEDLTLPESDCQRLQEIARHIKHKATMAESFGHSTRSSLGDGVIALFSGPNGTGKTMAAEVLANHLKLDLYRIDLANVVSKYIGETEKNLSKIFAAADLSSTILFFDEADSLFGKRSEVRDSHDRYANIEINYLLERMERFKGLAILATNMSCSIDEAFQRRFQFVIEFPSLTDS